MKGLKSLFLVLVLFSFLVNPVDAQRKMEVLDRGLVAVETDNGVFLSWRIMGYEWEGVSYNVYRDGIKLNSEPLEVSNFVDTDGTESSTYTVSAIVNSVEQEQCDVVSPWTKQYKNIVLKTRNTSLYEINDATAADLDGDGEYEIIVKRLNRDYTVANDSAYSYFEAYKLDGTLMWEINVGPNILSSSGVEINIAAFDFDEDGKAEVFMRTSEGTIFGDGTKIEDTDNDNRISYRYSVTQKPNFEYMTRGPEFLSLIDGETGAELDRVDYIPRYPGTNYPTDEQYKTYWGDSYGHRSNKFFFGAPYLDGKKPSLFISRGIYTRIIMRTYDVVDKKLVLRWQFNSENNPGYGYQGNHNYTVADVDEDGRDEIVYGGMTVDDDGTGLYTTKLGHGDALHVGNLDPYRKGTEIWRCLENSPVYGTSFYDGATGEILIHDVLGRDCGRCMAANITNTYTGAELWGSNNTYSASTLSEVSAGGSVNFRIFWDGDLLDELLDHTGTYDSPGSISKYGKGNIFVANGTLSCNWTKGTPTLQADLFGDWREEAIWRNEANTAIRIYTTVDATQHRIYTLMHDHQYRQAICWQMCGYNQPPHVSFFVGEKEGVLVPPPPTISNNKLVYNGTGDWNVSNANFNLDGSDQAYEDGNEVLFDMSSGDSVNLVATVQPKVVTINSPEDYFIDGTSGKLSGDMKLIKQGLGTFKITGNHDYTGETQVWNGSLIVDGTLQNSPVVLKFFGELEANGVIASGLTMRNKSILKIGEADSSGELTIGTGVTMQPASAIEFDLYAPASELNDSLVINGDFTFADNVVFKINPHLSDGTEKLEAGEYLLATVSGTINGSIGKVAIDGILGTASKLMVDNNKIYLLVKSVRAAASVVWNGNDDLYSWDLAESTSFLNEGVADVFVDQDEVTFNDDAAKKLVEIKTEVTPSAVIIDADEHYIFKGDGKISGSTTFTKNGSGKVLIYNKNDFTGKVTINGGEVIVSNISNSQEVGGLGAISSNGSLFELNGGQVTITDAGSADRAVYIGANGGTISNSQQVEWNESFSGGTLNVAGVGELVLAASNSHARTNINGGRLKLLYDHVSPGKVVSIRNGSTLQCSDNSYTYNTMSWNIEVPENNSGTINMDSRGYYTGKLTGAGSLKMNIPFVRTDLNGDMSQFTGTLNLFSTCTIYDSGQLNINNSNGLKNAHVIVNPNLFVDNGSGSTLKFGALSGTGTLSSNKTYEIGNKNTDSEFDGRITAGSLKKLGTGTFTLSNANTYNGGTTVLGGTLFAGNTVGSATGTGTVTVQNNGTLAGTGHIAGTVSVTNGGTLSPGNNKVGTSLSCDRNVSLASGSVYNVIMNPIFKYSNYLSTNGDVLIAGTLKITNSTTTDFKIGDEFKLFEANSITGSFEAIIPWKPGDGLSWDVSELESRGVIKVTISNSADDLSEIKAIVYPNPVQDFIFLNVENGQGNKLDVKISDYTGRNWESTVMNSEQLKLDVEHLPKGVYFITIESDKVIYQSRFVKK